MTDDAFAGTDQIAQGDRGPRWTTDRRPFVIALVIVLVIVACGYGLQLWGPLNPALRTTGSGGGYHSVAGGYESFEYLVIDNPSFSSLTIERVEVTAPGHPPVEATDVSFALVDDASYGSSYQGAADSAVPAAMPITVPARSRFVVAWTYPPELCAESSGGQTSTRTVVVLRSSWGREVTMPPYANQMTCAGIDR